MRTLRIILLFTLLPVMLPARTENDTATAGRKYRMLRIYTYGLPAYGDMDETSPCIAEAQKFYGFRYVRKAGCVVRLMQVWRWDLHNNRVERKMTRRFGADWRDRYYEKLNECEKR